MSTFEHAELIQNINESLTPFRKSQPDTMQAFGQLARSAMAEGEVSTKVEGWYGARSKVQWA